MDANGTNLDLIKNGEITGVVAQPLFEEFSMAAQLLDTVLRGGTVPFDNLLPAPIVTKDNYEPYYEILSTVKDAMDRYLK